MRLPYHKTQNKNSYKWHAWYLIVWYAIISLISIVITSNLLNEKLFEKSKSLFVVSLIIITSYTVYNIFTGIAFLKNNKKLFIISGMQFLFTVIVGVYLVISLILSKLYIYSIFIAIYYLIKIIVGYKINKTLCQKYIKEFYEK